MMKKAVKKFAAMTAAMVLVCAASGSSVQGADVTVPMPEPTDQKCSIIVHKYAMEDITLAGDPGDGTENPTLPDSAEALAGVEFKIVKMENDYEIDAEGVVDATFDEVSNTTDSDGIATFVDLPQGTYRVTETNKTGVTPAQPFLVRVPMTNPAGTGWMYDVHVYPKNETLSIDKFVEEIPNKDHTANVDEEHTWIITSKIPTDIVSKDKDGNITGVADKYQVTDELDTQLTYVKTVKLCGADADDKEIAGANLTVNTDYKVTATGTEEKGGTLVFALTESGIRKLVGKNAKKLHIHFVTKLNDTAELGVAIKNGAELEFTNVYGVESNPVKVPDGTDPDGTDERPEVHTGGVKIKKIEKGDAQNPLAGAKFSIYSSADDAKAGKNPIPVKNPDGNGFVTKVTSDANGIVKFFGLAYGKTGDKETEGTKDYWIAEVEAPSGYELLKTAYKVTVTPTSHKDETAPAVTISNQRKLGLPKTGGIGTVLFTVAGLTLMLAAIAVALKFRKKAE